MTAPSVIDVKSKVVSSRLGSDGYYRIVLNCPEVAKTAKPMQFINIKLGTFEDPFLRRPFSLSGIYPEEGLLEITWRVVGRGTKAMTSIEPGDTLSVLGPLGNGFVPESPRLWLVAGGSGLAPMFPLAYAARQKNCEVRLFYGARCQNELMKQDRFKEIGCEVCVATEDGSQGAAGYVTQQLESYVEDFDPRHQMMACGPLPMLSALKNLIGTSLELCVSLEARMACGIGLCKGCAVRLSGEEERYLHVCTDGPVFKAQDVFLEGEVRSDA